MHAVILERNKLVGRKVARQFLSVGASATVVEEPVQATTALAAGADVLCGDAFDGDYIAEQVRGAGGKLRGVLWTAEPLKRSLRHLVETRAPERSEAGGRWQAGIDHVLARRDFESPPRAWEIVMVARRLRDAGGAPPPLAAFVDWGFTAMDFDVRSTADRDTAVSGAQTFVANLTVPKRVADMAGELVHELVMNAMYDAPIDASGRPKYASDRKADVRLSDSERPAVRLASDGSRLVLQVRDPFGRLERRHVFDGLARGLAGGEQDRSHGGAGLGLVVCHHASTALFFDVAPRRFTEVTAVLELDLNLRELRTQAKSLHFWSAGN